MKTTICIAFVWVSSLCGNAGAICQLDQVAVVARAPTLASEAAYTQIPTSTRYNICIRYIEAHDQGAHEALQYPDQTYIGAHSQLVMLKRLHKSTYDFDVHPVVLTIESRSISLLVTLATTAYADLTIQRQL